MACFRKLLPFETRALSGHLLRLSAADRRARFGAVLADAGVVAHCRAIDWSSTVVLGYFAGGALRGAAELNLDGPGAGASAEFAVTVEAGWQDAGVGSELLRRTIVLARNRGVRRLWMLCLAENARMRRIAVKARGRLSWEEGQAHADVATPLPDFGSLLAEWVGDALGWATGWRERLRAGGDRAARAG